MKRFKKGLLLTSLISMTLLGSLTSCSAFFGDDGYLITNVTSRTDGEGNIIVTITFDSDEVEPLILTIPKGQVGEDGAGIQNIDYQMSEDGESVNLIISYTDGRSPTTINVPIVHGEDGKGIEGVTIDQTEDGNITIQFNYTDGTNSDTITIPKGEDGRGIEQIISEPLPGTNVSIITIHYTDETTSSFQISNGVGIESVEYSEALSTSTTYALVINYDDGNSETIYLPKPEATRWYTGATNPTDSFGNNGDFYINLASGEVFLKANSVWTPQFNIKGSGESTTQYYNVFFTLDSDANWVDEETFGTSTFTIRIEEGTTIPLENIPVPEKDGSTFLGWYTDLNNVNAGQFTDLTPVTKDLTLLAKWSEIV